MWHVEYISKKKSQSAFLVPVILSLWKRSPKKKSKELCKLQYNWPNVKARRSLGGYARNSYIFKIRCHAPSHSIAVKQKEQISLMALWRQKQKSKEPQGPAQTSVGSVLFSKSGFTLPWSLKQTLCKIKMNSNTSQLISSISFCYPFYHLW